MGVKKFIIKTLMTFSIFFIFFFVSTMTIEYLNNYKINTEFNIETEINNGEIVVPQEPLKVQANYAFSKFYFYTGLLVSFSMPIIFSIFGGIRIVKSFKIKKRLLEGSLLFIIYTVFSNILYFPKILFSSFYRGHLFGLSNLSFTDFLNNYFLGDLLENLVMIPIVGVLYLIFIKSRNWYRYFAVILIMISLGSNYIYPYYDEYVNDLEVMEDGDLKNKILDIANKAGIKDLDIFVIEKSNETNSMNAYMTGIFNSRRIVFWDTTLEGMTENEILSVAAHEMGHYKLNHILKQTVISIVGIVLFLVILNKLLKKYKGDEYRTINNIPYILVLINIMSIIITPFETAYSRNNEIEADKYAIEITSDAKTNGDLEIKFINTNLTPVNPTGLYKWLAYDHPTAKERIELSNEMNKN